MTIETVASDDHGAVAPAGAASRFGADVLRPVAIAAGIAWAALFIAVGLHDGLQMYGDGSIFSYAVAVQDAWLIHWHNISGRLTVYLLCFVPAEAVVAWTGNALAGVAAYGALHFAAQACGLAATFAADRSPGRILFGFACFSTACVCPLVFGFPTEMWMAHALFWPTLTVCHFARRSAAGAVLVFALLLALSFTHEGALILAATILLTLLPRGWRDAAFVRAAGSWIAVLAIWFAVKAIWRPDAYIAGTLENAEMNFFDIGILTGDLFLLLVAALTGYGVLLSMLRAVTTPGKAAAGAAAIVAVALAVYWLWFDRSLHAENRYFMRTILLLATAGLGVLASAFMLDAERPLPEWLMRPLRHFASRAGRCAIAGAVAVVMLIHAVETAKFIAGWTGYTAAVRTLATGTASDPALGDPRFVSSARIAPGLNRLSWSSTTPYLSVLLAPNLLPARLVMDPDADYFWLSCRSARSIETAGHRAVPAASQGLLRALECLHR